MKSFSATKTITTVLIVLLLGLLGVYFYSGGFSTDKNISPIEFEADARNNVVKIGYFFGGRIHAVYRAYINDYFEREGVGVELQTQFLLQDEWHEVPKQHEAMIRLTLPREESRAMGREFGKVTGIRIIEAMDQGLFAAGTPGESSFVYKITMGSPLVAVALLGHDDKDMPGKGLVVREGLAIEDPQDFKGKTLISRRAGPGDAIWLREFLKDIGLDPENDVTILDQVPDDLQAEYLKTGKADAALLHMHGVPQVERGGIAYLYRGMDWMNPELSNALLVFRKDFVEQYPQKVQAVVNAYMKRVKFEHGLPEEEQHREDDFGLRIAHHYKGLSLPIFDYPPLVRLDLLEETQRMLIEYGEIDDKVDISDFVDNSFVERAAENMSTEEGP